MDKRIELLEQLRKLDAEIQEMRGIEAPTPEDLVKLNGLCDQVGEVDEKLKGLDIEDRAAAINERNQAPIEVTHAEGDPLGSNENRFASFGEQLIAIARACQPGALADNRLIYSSDAIEQRAPTGLAIGTPSLGGFLVQTDFSSEILKRMYETSIIFNRTRQIPISANANGLKIPYIDETSRADGSRWSGIRMIWLEEAAEKTASKPKFGQIQLSLKKIAGIAYATDEALQDAMALGAIITQGFSDELGFKLDDAMINGTGAGQPIGVLNAASLVTVAKESGQVAKTIVWDNIMKMYAQMWPRSLPNAVWLINQNTLVQLMSMTIPVGTGGIPVWMPANLAQGRPNSTLMGMPVMPVEQCATLGTVGDIILGDWSQYVTITKGGLQSAQSMHVRFINDEQVFRFVFRCDGQPTWQSSLTPFKDASTSKPVGPFLVLATRA